MKLIFGPHDEWTADMTWYEGDRNGPGELVVRATDPDKRPAGGVSQTVLREIDFTKVVDAIRGTQVVAESIPKINWETIGIELADMSASGISDEYLAMLSVAYSASSKRPKPLEFLGELSGKSPAAIKNHLWQATRKGLLERSPGRAGGSVTLKAIGLLDHLDRAGT
ncbi:hypothetical protein [Mycobacterium sp.]|uniref:hypothetical protein n=1 Tax=Mycobacterium sp. TaxID=1785 RepID=UPI003BAD801E